MCIRDSDGVGPLGEQVRDLSLALIAPLGADDHYSRHDQVIMERWAAESAPAALRPGHAIAEVVAEQGQGVSADLDQA